MTTNFSIILPAKNEELNLGNLLDEIRRRYPHNEIIVVNDGSTDKTRLIAESNADLVINHPYSMGNGAAIKSGARVATGEILIFMDGDGQHDPKDIKKLLQAYAQGYEMVIGARSTTSQASLLRKVGNGFYNRLASVITGVKITDLTSGFRAVNAEKFKQFLYLLPNGFSYPTTITMAFLRSGYAINYIPIIAKKRAGKSKINLFRDGTKFLLIILKIGSLFSPMRLFLPISLSIFCSGLLYYGYTFITAGRLTNMSVVLFLAAVLVFLIGIVSEQIAALHFHAIDQTTKNKPANFQSAKKDRS